VIVGIGLNVNTGRSQLLKTATSIALETGQKTDKRPILDRILAVFWAKYEEATGLKKHPKKALKARYFEHA
jgi:biotin-(acetyl-CoA carboxylase) ligase